MLTAILSSFNEVHNEVFWDNLKLLSKHSAVEILVVDGGSQDGTLDRLGDYPLYGLENSQRGGRYNYGITKAKGHVILLVHPRSLLSQAGIEYLTGDVPQKSWGAFRHGFDFSHPLLKFTSWYSNFVRGKRRGIFYLDHCLYFTADLKAWARFPDVAIFEDTYFCRSLSKKVWPTLLPFTVTTSAIRFRKNGILRQSLFNQALKVMFMLGVSERWMNKVYEKGMALNARG